MDKTQVYFTSKPHSTLLYSLLFKCSKCWEIKMANTLYFSTYYLPVLTIILYFKHISYLAYLILVRTMIRPHTHYSIEKETKAQRGSVTFPKPHSC